MSNTAKIAKLKAKAPTADHAPVLSKDGLTSVARADRRGVLTRFWPMKAEFQVGMEPIGKFISHIEEWKVFCRKYSGQAQRVAKIENLIREGAPTGLLAAAASWVVATFWVSNPWGKFATWVLIPIVFGRVSLWFTDWTPWRSSWIP